MVIALVILGCGAPPEDTCTPVWMPEYCPALRQCCDVLDDGPVCWVEDTGDRVWDCDRWDCRDALATVCPVRDSG